MRRDAEWLDAQVSPTIFPLFHVEFCGRHARDSHYAESSADPSMPLPSHLKFRKSSSTLQVIISRCIPGAGVYTVL